MTEQKGYRTCDKLPIVNAVTPMPKCKPPRPDRKPDYITLFHYDKNMNLIDKKHVYHDKEFEEYWGDRGEKWNGKLDIKQFSYEIWKDAKSKEA